MGRLTININNKFIDRSPEHTKGTTEDMYTGTGNEHRSVRELGARRAQHRIRIMERESFTIDFVHEYMYICYRFPIGGERQRLHCRRSQVKVMTFRKIIN